MPRRFVVALVVVLGLLAPTPSLAGIDSWSQSGCRPEVWWWMESQTRDVWYWRDGWPQYEVAGNWRNWYERYGWECGSLGAVTSTVVQVSGYHWKQHFERGWLAYSSGYWFICYYPGHCYFAA